MEGVWIKQSWATAAGRAGSWHLRRRLRVCLAALRGHVRTACAMQATVAAAVMRISSGGCTPMQHSTKACCLAP